MSDPFQMSTITFYAGILLKMKLIEDSLTLNNGSEHFPHITMYLIHCHRTPTFHISKREGSKLMYKWADVNSSLKIMSVDVQPF